MNFATWALFELFSVEERRILLSVFCLCLRISSQLKDLIIFCLNGELEVNGA